MSIHLHGGCPPPPAPPPTAGGSSSTGSNSTGNSRSTGQQEAVSLMHHAEAAPALQPHTSSNRTLSGPPYTTGAQKEHSLPARPPPVCSASTSFASALLARKFPRLKGKVHPSLTCSSITSNSRGTRLHSTPLRHKGSPETHPLQHAFAHVAICELLPVGAQHLRDHLRQLLGLPPTHAHPLKPPHLHP